MLRLKARRIPIFQLYGFYCRVFKVEGPVAQDLGLVGFCLLRVLELCSLVM